jgi:hypothetical protein
MRFVNVTFLAAEPISSIAWRLRRPRLDSMRANEHCGQQSQRLGAAKVSLPLFTG